jgi:hypothetical protein
MAKHGVFNNPIAPKTRKADKNFSAPTKEQATTGQYMAAGDYYGTGFKQPVGKMRGGSVGMNPVPQKSLKIAPESLA